MTEPSRTGRRSEAPTRVDSEPEPEQSNGGPPPATRWRSGLLAVGVFLVAAVTLFHPVLSVDPSQRITVVVWPDDVDADETQPVQRDQSFVVRLLSRNARTLIEHPTRLFDSETCFPAERSLALGEPMLSHGAMAVPLWIATSDPVLTFNLLQWLLPLTAAAAMFLLVRRWTGSTAGGVVAGLLYAFSPVHNADILHFYIHDTSFTVLAIFFADRWLEAGRWRDALGLGAAVALQVGGSLYPIVAAAILAPPLFGWMIYRHGVRRTHWAQWVAIAAVIAAAALFVYLPYLDVRSERGVQAGLQLFMTWREQLPSGRSFAGYSAWLLVIGGVALVPLFGSRGSGPARGERGLSPLLLLVTVMVFFVAAGGNTGDRLAQITAGAPLSNAWPDPFSILAWLVPGLDLVRAPVRIAVGAHLSISLLAGLGASVLGSVVTSRVSRRAGATVSCVLVSLVFLEMLAPTAVGLPRRIVVKSRALRPAPETLAVYSALAEPGMGGPVYEAPRFRNAFVEVHSVLYAAYHRERTSACAASFLQRESDEMRALQEDFPSVESVQRMADLGFRAITLHHPGGLRFSKYARDVQRRLSLQASPTLELVATSRDVTAYSILLQGRAPGGD